MSYSNKNEALDLLNKYHNKFDGKLNEIERNLELVANQTDRLDIANQEGGRTSSVKADPIRNMIVKNFDKISGSGSVKLESKAVGDMLLTTHLTGDQPRDYSFEVAMKPGQLVNVSDLVPSFKIQGGTYTWPSEEGGENSPAWHVEGAEKAQVDYDLEMKDCSTEFLSAYATYSKKMKNNLPFLERFLPQALRRDYWKAENSAFMTLITAGVTASSELAASHDTYAEQIVKEVANLEEAGFQPNYIVVRPSDWYKILTEEKSTGSSYGLPGSVYFQNGQIYVNGILLVKALWLGTSEYLVGNFNGMKKIITEGLSLEFSEASGFRKNTIDVRIESQVALAIEQGSGIIKGSFIAV